MPELPSFMLTKLMRCWTTLPQYINFIPVLNLNFILSTLDLAFLISEFEASSEAAPPRALLRVAHGTQGEGSPLQVRKNQLKNTIRVSPSCPFQSHLLFQIRLHLPKRISDYLLSIINIKQSFQFISAISRRSFLHYGSFCF